MALAGIMMLGTLAFGQNEQLNGDLGKSFSKFDVARTGESLRTNGGKKQIHLSAAGRSVELNIAPHDVRSPRYRAEDTTSEGVRLLERTPVNTYKGTIAGTAKSQVRLTINGGNVEGYFESNGERFLIEPASKYSSSAAAGELVVYKAEDSLLKNEFFCGSDIEEKMEHGKSLAKGQTPIGSLTFQTIEIATDADREYVNLLGGAAQANSEILSIFNMIEGVYESELGLTFRVVYQHTWSTADPFDGTNTTTLLETFRTHWNAAYPTATVPRDAAHLFSGKANALFRGRAFINVICANPAFAYAISGHIDFAPGKFLVPAHEVGHNLGANHAEAAQSCSNTLMNAQLTNDTPISFCSFSRGEIGNFVAGNGSCLTAGTGALFDFDGDRRADQAVFRPATGVWYINRSGSGFNAFGFGQNGDKAISSDFDGDGLSDAAVYRSGIWYRLMSATNTVDGVIFGLSSDIPTPADLNGDGKAEIAVFRPSDGYWYWLSSIDGAFAAVRFGTNGDVPIPTDYDGDGRADINVFRPSTGVWYRINSSNGSFFVTQFGQNGDKPVIGDFDGDARADVAVYRPSGGEWFYLRSSNNSFYGNVFGLSTDLPTPADYDGDGRTDIAVYRPSDGIWYRLNSSDGTFAAVRFGISSDQPLPSFYTQ